MYIVSVLKIFSVLVSVWVLLISIISVSVSVTGISLVSSHPTVQYGMYRSQLEYLYLQAALDVTVVNCQQTHTGSSTCRLVVITQTTLGVTGEVHGTSLHTNLTITLTLTVNPNLNHNPKGRFPLPEFTGRVDGLWTLVHFLTPVNSGRPVS